MPEKRSKRNDDPAQRALEAANQALAAANAAVQAAVKALAFSSSRHQEEEAEHRARGGGSIRKAASQARRSAGGEASGEAPLSSAPSKARSSSARAVSKPAAPPRPAAEPRPPATPRKAAPSPAAPPVARSAPPKRAADAHAESPTRAKIRKSLESEVAPLPPRPLPTEAQPRTSGNGATAAPERQATQRPEGAGPIRLGPSSAPPAPPPEAPSQPDIQGPSAPEVAEAAKAAALAQAEAARAAAAAQAEAAEAARHEADLREREQELAAREAAMARYAPMEPARTVPAKPQAEPNGYTVLVVDDEEQVRALTVRILTRFGYRVLEASGVEIALALLDEPTANVDLVLSDVAMPGLSGKDLFRAISQSRPGLPVVFMSGYALGVYAPEGLIEEGVKMLPKPFTQEDLLGFVTEALEGAAAR